MLSYSRKTRTVQLMARCMAILLAILICSAPWSFAAEETDPGLVSVTLPGDIPFRLVIPRNGGVGFVKSNEFVIANNGVYATVVGMESVWADVTDSVNYTLADNAELPDTGNCLYLSLVCVQNGISAEYTLTDTPTTAHSFRLESGETASFRITGTVSELEDASWEQTTVTVSVRFALTPELPPDEKIPAAPDASESAPVGDDGNRPDEQPTPETGESGAAEPTPTSTPVSPDDTPVSDEPVVAPTPSESDAVEPAPSGQSTPSSLNSEP